MKWGIFNAQCYTCNWHGRACTPWPESWTSSCSLLCLSPPQGICSISFSPSFSSFLSTFLYHCQSALQMKLLVFLPSNSFSFHSFSESLPTSHLAGIQIQFCVHLQENNRAIRALQVGLRNIFIWKSHRLKDLSLLCDWTLKNNFCLASTNICLNEHDKRKSNR